MLEEVAEHLQMEKRLMVGGCAAFARDKKKLFRPASAAAFFSSLECCRLILAALELGLAEGGCDIDLNKEIADGVLIAVVPMHEAAVAEERLMKAWARAPLRALPEQPLDDIRDYFGEQIAFYFAFVQTLTAWLLVPSLAGLVALGGTVVYGTPDNPLCPLYSLVILVWISGFCKAWRRAEARLAFRWHVEEFGARPERPRTEFAGPLARGFYSPEGYFIDVGADDALAAAAPLTKRFARTARRVRMLWSAAGLVASLTVLATVGIVGVLSYRTFLQLSFAAARTIELGVKEHVTLASTYVVTIGWVLGGVCNAIFIALTNGFYAHVAARLSAWENHRTEEAYEHALILKTYAFHFVNSYASLFYIAFVKAAQLDVVGALGFTEGQGSAGEYCHDPAAFAKGDGAIRAAHSGLNPYCMGELSTMLTSLVITSQIIGRLSESCRSWHRAYAEARATRQAGVVDPPPLTYYERQCKLEPFRGVFDEYSRRILQLGYAVLFAPAFPVASLVCYVSFLLELRTDAYKLLANTRRSRYAGARGIGAWQHLLFALGLLGTLTNLGLIGYTSTALSNLLPLRVLGVFEVRADNKATALFACEHLLLATQLLVQYALPDIPVDVAMTRATLSWRRRASAALDGSGGRALVVDDTEHIKQPPVAWDDSAIPERFWREMGEGAALAAEPRSHGREAARVVQVVEPDRI